MHPLSKELHEVRFGKRSKPGLYGGYPEWEQRAADTLDAYHEALDGLEIVRCGMCDGGGQGVICDQPSMPAHGYIGDCPSCNGTGKRLRKKDSAPEAGEE